MIEETGTSGSYEPTEETEIPVMEPSVTRGTLRRSRDEGDVTISVKRRRYDSKHEENVFQLQYRDVDVNSHQNIISTDESAVSVNYGSISDLKVECVSVTDMFISSNDCFSRETSTSSTVVCFESEEMESSSSTVNNKHNYNNNKKKKKKKKNLTVTVEATSLRKTASTAAVMMPSASELEEFFSAAEKYEQKRFVEKYNYDIMKDVPMEGRYQWVPLKP